MRKKHFIVATLLIAVFITIAPTTIAPSSEQAPGTYLEVEKITILSPEVTPKWSETGMECGVWRRLGPYFSKFVFVIEPKGYISNITKVAVSVIYESPEREGSAWKMRLVLNGYYITEELRIVCTYGKPRILSVPADLEWAELREGINELELMVWGRLVVYELVIFIEYEYTKS